MQLLQKIRAVMRSPKMDSALVETLYTLSEKSLVLVGILSLFVSYFLFPVLGSFILFWNFFVLLVLGYRLYMAVLFKKYPGRYQTEIWYQKFTRSAYLSALLYGFLGIAIFLTGGNTESHLFVTIVLLGLSGGADTAFLSDHRLAIRYSLILIVPLIAGMLIHDGSTYLLMAAILLVFAGSKIAMMLQSIRQEYRISKQASKIDQTKHALQEKQNLIYNFIEEAPVAIFSYDKYLNITDANRVLLSLFHADKKEIIGLSIASLPDTRILPAVKEALTDGPQLYRGTYLSRGGRELWIELICFPFNDAQGKVAGGIGMIHDKSTEHSALTTLRFNAKHDQLTSLLNRRGLKDYLESFIQKKKHAQYYSVLFYLDLNKFKYINDSLGHRTGDKLLVTIAHRLQKLSQDGCIISRFGGDEFIILYPFVTTKKEELDTKIEQYTSRIQALFAEPFMLDGMHLSMQTSIGIVIIEPAESDMEEIIRHADIAMYQAKKSHHTHISYYDTQLDEERKEIFRLQHDLVFAIRHDQLKLYLQPLVSIDNDILIAAECLVRWEHPTYGLLAPDRFIPTAIETGTISAITWWIIEELCREVSKLKKAGVWHLEYISVNVDAKQFLVNHFVDELLSILEKYAIRNSELMIEITEQSLIDNFEGTQEIITALKAEGIHCAIDDFGIGYSSLSYLKKLSFHTLKIDKEFIKDIQDRQDDILLIKTILEIGRKFNYTIVVEGIETEVQKKLLQDIDPNLIYQGYLLEKPLPFDTFVQKYLQQH